MTYVDLEMADGLGLPYVVGAEAALSGIDEAFDAAWQALTAVYPGLTLDPVFGELEDLDDLVAQALALGNQPPSMTSWFGVDCPDELAEDLRAALYALPFVVQAVVRNRPVPAGVVSWGTNPRTHDCLQFQTAPAGVNAVHAWQVRGGTGRDVRLADVEFGWGFAHEDLDAVNWIDGSSIFGSPAQDVVDHGTASVGIVAAPDNGLGIVGIAPDAGIALVSADRGGVPNTAAAVLLAARAVGQGGILLTEVAEPFVGALDKPDLMIEFNPVTQAAVRMATALGVTVIEPAGNGGLDIDSLPATAHLSPDSPTFSGAVVVGAGSFDRSTGVWSRASFSVHGRRVDCFADGTRALAPWTPPDTYIEFSGTSSASAIVAGVAASLQGMALAQYGRPFTPAEMRAQLGDPSLGTLLPGLGDGIGPMPDLGKLAAHNGFPRLLTPGIAAGPGGTIVLTSMDPTNVLDRRVYDAASDAWSPLALDPADLLEVVPGQPVVLATDQDDRTRFEVLALSGGVHHMWWDTAGGSGRLTRVTDRATVSQSSDPAAVRTSDRSLVVVAVDEAGRLVSTTGDPVQAPGQLLPAPQPVLSGVFRRCAGPSAVSRGSGTVDVVAVDDDGVLHWATGSSFATTGTGWSASGSDPSGLTFLPGARPALLAMDDGVLMVAAVGTEGVLRATTLDTTTGTFGTPFESWEAISPDVVMGRCPLALGVAGDNVVLLGTDTSQNLQVTVRAWAGGTFSPLEVIAPVFGADDMAGVVATASDELGLAVVVTDFGDGTHHLTSSWDGISWTALTAVR